MVVLWFVPGKLALGLLKKILVCLLGFWLVKDPFSRQAGRQHSDAGLTHELVSTF